VTLTWRGPSRTGGVVLACGRRNLTLRTKTSTAPFDSGLPTADIANGGGSAASGPQLRSLAYAMEAHRRLITQYMRPHISGRVPASVPSLERARRASLLFVADLAGQRQSVVEKEQEPG
jgi:hypothetical protein